MKNKRFYHYCGPIIRFGKVVTNHWSATTFATSPQQALSNLTFRAKMKFKYDSKAKLALDKNCLKEV